MKSPIKIWMEKNEITRHDMADRMGWSQPFLSDFVNGKHPEPVWHKIKKLEVVTGIKREVIEDWLQSLLDEKAEDLAELESKSKQKTKTSKGKRKKSS